MTLAIFMAIDDIIISIMAWNTVGGYATDELCVIMILDCIFLSLCCSIWTGAEF